MNIGRQMKYLKAEISVIRPECWVYERVRVMKGLDPAPG